MMTADIYSRCMNQCLFYPAVKNNFNYELLHLRTEGNITMKILLMLRATSKKNYILSGHVPLREGGGAYPLGKNKEKNKYSVSVLQKIVFVHKELTFLPGGGGLKALAAMSAKNEFFLGRLPLGTMTMKMMKVLKAKTMLLLLSELLELFVVYRCCCCCWS